MDFEADVPAVLCGVAVCGSTRSVGLGDGGCCEKFCDDVVVCGAGGGGDDDGSEGFAEGVGVLDGCFVVFACGADAGDGFACGHVVGCSKRVVFAFELGDGVVEGLCVGDGCGVGAFCTFYDTCGGEVEGHGGDSPVLVFGADLPGCPGRGDVVLGAVSSAGSGFRPAVPGYQPLIIYRGLRGI